MIIEESPGCCAVGEICELSDHSNPKDAMLAFCRSLRGFGGDLRPPDAFYIFTGVVGNINRPDYSICENGDDPEDVNQYEEDVEYAPKFAQYIRDHKLGPVKESVGRANKKFHPDHKVKVYIWAPSFRAIKAWWRENGN
jgi:hypothetical protein